MSRRLLLPLCPVYGAVVSLRNRWYDRPAAAWRAPLPVIAVGNLSTGGTGKTPMGLHLAGLLRGRGLRPAVVLRGYAPAGGPSDEAALYRAGLGADAVRCGADRRAVITALPAGRFDAVILDDAFQHRRVFRDLDIVLLDATRPLAADRLLPAGDLREPPGGLARAGAVVFTRTDQCAEDDLAAQERHARGLAPAAPLFRSRMRALPLRDLQGGAAGPDDGPFFLVCGIGSPASFRRQAVDAGLAVAGQLAFPDHHPFSAADLRDAGAAARAAGARALLVTEKDAVRWPAGADLPVRVLPIRLEVRPGPDGRTLDDLVLARVGRS